MTKLTGIIMSENKLTGSLGVRNEINVDIIGTGARGEDGYTPIKGIDYFDGIDGKDGRNGVDGKNGKDGVDGYTPVKGVDYFDGAKGDKGDPADLTIATDTILGGIKVGENLKIDENGVLSVDTTANVSQDNTKPVTSAAVHVQLGNVETLLAAL